MVLNGDLVLAVCERQERQLGLAHLAVVTEGHVAVEGHVARGEVLSLELGQVDGWREGQILVRIEEEDAHVAPPVS